jgi:hypothetical protein
MNFSSIVYLEAIGVHLVGSWCMVIHGHINYIPQVKYIVNMKFAVLV